MENQVSHIGIWRKWWYNRDSMEIVHQQSPFGCENGAYSAILMAKIMKNNQNWATLLTNQYLIHIPFIIAFDLSSFLLTNSYDSFHWLCIFIEHLGWSQSYVVYKVPIESNWTIVNWDHWDHHIVLMATFSLNNI